MDFTAMPRANRHYLPGYVWHLTHRCHRRQFLLKFDRDRSLWRRWLYEARCRYGLCVFDYTATSNHIHLLVRDQGRGEIAASMQLLEGCTAQRFNQRKQRSGAFWEDRYHATAVETGAHLARCLVYIDLNMVRAGVVAHPEQWAVSGYHEIQRPRRRYVVVDREALAEALGIEIGQLADTHRSWVEAALRDGAWQREAHWTESVAVGSRGFVERVQGELGTRGRYRTLEEGTDMWVLRETPGRYGAHFDAENRPMDLKRAQIRS
jgi:putative transposase